MANDFMLKVRTFNMKTVLITGANRSIGLETVVLIKA